MRAVCTGPDTSKYLAQVPALLPEVVCSLLDQLSCAVGYNCLINWVVQDSTRLPSASLGWLSHWAAEVHHTGHPLDWSQQPPSTDSCYALEGNKPPSLKNVVGYSHYICATIAPVYVPGRQLLLIAAFVTERFDDYLSHQYHAEYLPGPCTVGVKCIAGNQLNFSIFDDINECCLQQ